MPQKHYTSEHTLYTHKHKNFACLSITCEHDYYTAEVCPDLYFELSGPSKAYLSAHQIQYKEETGRLLVESGLDTPLPTAQSDSIKEIVVLGKVARSRFWLVTKSIKNGSKSQPFNRSHLPFLINEKGKFFKAHTEKEYRAQLLKQHTIEQLPRDTVLIIIIPINKLKNKKKEKISIELSAPKVKLRYCINRKPNEALGDNQLQVKDIFGKPPLKAIKGAELSLQVKPSEIDKPNQWCLESKEKWALRQSPPQSGLNYFEFEAEVDPEKLPEEKARVILPFPTHITADLFKEGKTILQQEVNKLRFSAIKKAKT